VRAWIEKVAAVARDPLRFLRAHWRDIAVLVAAPAAFIGVTILLGVLGAPALVALAVGGLASGLAGFAASWLLGGEPFSAKRLALMCAVGVLLAVIPLGALRSAGLVSPSLPGRVLGSTWAKLAGVKAISKAEAVGIEVTAVKTADEKGPEPAPSEPATESATPREPVSVGIVNRLDEPR